jgi:hypothetical protein
MEIVVVVLGAFSARGNIKDTQAAAPGALEQHFDTPASSAIWGSLEGHRVSV